jgi:hypothetical protein
MKLLIAVAACSIVAAAQNAGIAKEEPATDATLAKNYGGRVWTDGESAPPRGDQLKGWLAANHTGAELTRKSPEGSWTLNYVAVFRKAAAKGPMIVSFFDKTDPKNIVDQCTRENPEASVVSKGTCDLDPDHGFNRGRSYLVKVGQIINGKFLPYAAGEVSLK